MACVSIIWSRLVLAKCTAHPALRADDRQFPVLACAALRQIQNDAQTSRVDAVGGVQIEHHLRRPLIKLSEETLPEGKAVGHVDLAAHLDDDDAVCRSQRTDVEVLDPHTPSVAGSSSVRGYRAVGGSDRFAVDARRENPGEKKWLARKDSNLQSPDPESGALPIRPLASDVESLPRGGGSLNRRRREESRLSGRFAAREAVGRHRGRARPSGPVLASLLLQLGPGVLEREGAVEHERARRRVGVRAEVAEPLELHGLADGQVGERRLHEAAAQHGLGVRVDVLEDVAAVRPGVRAAEEVVVQPDLGGHRVRGRQPVQRGLGAAAVGSVAAARRRVVACSAARRCRRRRP